MVERQAITSVETCSNKNYRHIGLGNMKIIDPVFIITS